MPTGAMVIASRHISGERGLDCYINTCSPHAVFVSGIIAGLMIAFFIAFFISNWGKKN